MLNLTSTCRKPYEKQEWNSQQCRRHPDYRLYSPPPTDSRIGSSGPGHRRPNPQMEKGRSIVASVEARYHPQACALITALNKYGFVTGEPCRTSIIPIGNVKIWQPGKFPRVSRHQRCAVG